MEATNELPIWVQSAYEIGRNLVKRADEAAPAYNLSGMLYLAPNGWLVLSVPSAMVRGVFAAMHEPGIELPPNGPDGKFSAQIGVMSPEEVKQVGEDKITERGKQFRYTLGRLYSVEPKDWPHEPAVARAWYLIVHSPALQELRRSYALTGLPADGQQAFYVAVAVRRRGVLGRNEKTKVSAV